MKKLFTALTIIALCAGGAFAFGIILGEEEGPFNIYVVKRTAAVLPSDILIDAFAGVNGTDLVDHDPDTNTTGDVYHPGRTGRENYMEINNVDQLITKTTTSWFEPEYWIDLNTTGGDSAVTYQYMQNTVSTSGDLFFIGIRGSHTGGGGSALVASAFFVALYNNSGTGQIRFYKITTGSNNLLDTVSVGAINLNTMYPIKIVDNGSNIKVYADNSGSEATTLRIDYDTTDYSTNTELHFSNAGYTNTLLDTLSITR